MNAKIVHFAKQTIIGGASTFLNYTRFLFIMPFLTRSLGTSGYGIWIQISIGIELFSTFAALGLNYALLRYIPTYGEPRQGTGDLWLSIFVCWTVCLPVIFIGLIFDEWLAHNFLGGANQTLALQLSLILIPLSGALNLAFIYLRAAQLMSTYFVFIAFETSGWFLLAYVIFLFEHGLIPMIVGLIAIKLVILAMISIVILWRNGLEKPNIKMLVPHLRYCLPLLPLGLLQWIINASDRYFISYFCAPETVGIYAVSYAIGSITSLAYAPIFFVLVPTLVELWNAQTPKETLEYLKFVQKYPFLLAVPGTLILIAYSNKTINIIATSAFSATPMLIAYIASAIVIFNIGAIVQSILSVTDLTGRILVISFIAAIFNILANAIVVPHYGAIGAGATTLLTYILWTTISHFMSRSSLPFPWAWRLMVLSLVAAIPLLFIINLKSNNILLTIIGCLIYLVLLFIFGIFEPREWQLIRTLLRRDQEET